MARSSPMCVPAVVDVEDAHRSGGVVDRVAHAVLPATGSPPSLERSFQHCSDCTGSSDQRSGDELPRSKRGAVLQAIGERTARARGQDQSVGILIHPLAGDVDLS